MSRLKIILLFTLLVSGFWFLVSTSPALAQDDPSMETGEHMGAILDSTQNLSRFSFEDLDALGGAGGSTLLGIYDENGKPLTQNSVFGSTTKVLAQMITEPPIQSSYYIADLLHNSNLVPQAYAQGIGFSALSPVLNIWKAFRNLAYFAFIIIFVIVGIMIMFRAQIDPHTVVTVQAALPKMVVTLLLITFSYAIAGFVIDLIYLLFFVVTSLFESVGLLNNAANTRNVLFGRSIFRIGFSYLIPFEAGADASRAAGNLFSSAMGIPRWLQGIASSIFYLIIAVAIVIALFRTLFSLILSWISIILSVIFAPLQLLVNAVPGVNTFGAWIKGLIANALVFPAVGIMLVIGVALTGSQSSLITDEFGINTQAPSGGGGGTGWVPPLVTSSDPGRTGTNQIGAIIGLGIIMILPEVSKMIKKLVGSEDSGLGELATQGLQRGSGTVTSPFRMIGGAATQIGMSYVSQNMGGWYQTWKAKRATSQDENANKATTTDASGRRLSANPTLRRRQQMQEQGEPVQIDLGPGGGGSKGGAGTKSEDML